MRVAKSLDWPLTTEIAHPVGMSFVRRARAARFIGEARRMPQQILDGEFALCRYA